MHLQTKAAKAGLRSAALAGVLAIAALGTSAGSANATIGAHCSGSAITGQGSSLQKTAQGIFTDDATLLPAGTVLTGKGFNNNASGCASVSVRYTVTSSGSCVNNWGGGGGTFNNTLVDDYCGTDDAVTPAQATAIDAAARTAGGNTATPHVLVIPTVQAAIAIIARPPTNCTISQIDNVDLEKVFRGTITTWAGISTASGTGCTGAITRVVRSDSSGTTYQAKHYLSLIDNSADCLTSPNNTWSALQATAFNTTWPVNGSGSCTGLSTLTSASGGGALVSLVNSTTGSIGYVALADAENATTIPTILKVQNNGLVTTGQTYVGPATATGRNANCGSSSYTVPTGARSGGGGKDIDWTGVYGSATTIATYGICTLSHSLALDNYVGSGLTNANATSVHDFLAYATGDTLGQTDISGFWYARLPRTGVAATDVSASAAYEVGLIN